MSILEMQVDALMRLCAAETEADRQNVRSEVRSLLRGAKKPASADPEQLIRDLLLELGAPDHLLGHAYLVRGILLVVEDRTFINNITFGLYPQLAVLFDSSPARVERAIRHAIEVTWTRGDMAVLEKYFGNTISPDKGKPTNGEFIARMANVVKARMKEGTPVQ